MNKLVALFAVLLLKTSVIALMSHLSIVDSISMEPALLSGDIVLCSRNINANDILLGDIVFFRSLEDDSTLLVKRVHDIKFTVPNNPEFDVRGDNKRNSCDSRNFGWVPMDKIDGKVLLVLASWESKQKTFRSGRFMKRVK